MVATSTSASRKHPQSLVNDADTVLSGPVALQGFQAVAWRGAKVVDRSRSVDHIELPQRHLGNLLLVLHSLLSGFAEWDHFSLSYGEKERAGKLP